MTSALCFAALCVDFLRYFVDEQDSSKYMKQLARIVERTRQLLEVNLDDLQGVSTPTASLVTNLMVFFCTL